MAAALTQFAVHRAEPTVTSGSARTTRYGQPAYSLSFLALGNTTSGVQSAGVGCPTQRRHLGGDEVGSACPLIARCRRHPRPAEPAEVVLKHGADVGNGTALQGCSGVIRRLGHLFIVCRAFPFVWRTSLASTGDGASIDFDSRDPTLVADRPDPAPYAALWADHGDITLFGAWGPIERGYGPVTRTFDWGCEPVLRRRSGPAPRGDRVQRRPRLNRRFRASRSACRRDESVEMTIRVTDVLRRLDGNWRIVHWHADFPPADQRHTSPEAEGRAPELHSDIPAPGRLGCVNLARRG